MTLRIRDFEIDLETSQLLPCYIAKALVKFPDFCNEARCRQFSAKVSNSPNVITQPLQKVIFHQSLSHRLYISRIFSNVKFYFMLLEIHLTSSPNHSKIHDISNEIFFTQDHIFRDIFKSHILSYAFDNSLDIITKHLQKSKISAIRYFFAHSHMFKDILEC